MGVRSNYGSRSDRLHLGNMPAEENHATVVCDALTVVRRRNVSPFFLQCKMSLMAHHDMRSGDGCRSLRRIADVTGPATCPSRSRLTHCNRRTAPPKRACTGRDSARSSYRHGRRLSSRLPRRSHPDCRVILERLRVVPPISWYSSILFVWEPNELSHPPYCPVAVLVTYFGHRRLAPSLDPGVQNSPPRDRPAQPLVR